MEKRRAVTALGARMDAIKAAKTRIDFFRILDKWFRAGCVRFEGAEPTGSHVSIMRMSRLTARVLFRSERSWWT
eukprot:3935049-Rhodomonas_salina.1